MSQSFSQSPPVYSSSTVPNQSPSVYSNSTVPNQSTPYPTNLSSMPMPMPMPMGVGTNSSYVNPYAYPQAQFSQDVYRESLQSAVLDKVRNSLNEKIEIIKAEIDSLKKTEEDLNNGDK